VYVCAPDGSAVASLSVVQSADPAKMAAFLEGIAAQLHVTPGPPAVKPHPTSRPGPIPPGGLAIHLVSRAIAGGSWHEFPSENWIVLTREESAQLLPKDPPALRDSWTVPHPVARKLAEWVYPQNEERTSQNRSRVDGAHFEFTVVAVQGSLARAKLEGKIRLLHAFSPGSTAQDFAVSAFTGYMDFDSAESHIQRLRLVTEKADYNGTPFEAVLISMSKESLEGLLK